MFNWSFYNTIGEMLHESHNLLYHYIKTNPPLDILIIVALYPSITSHSDHFGYEVLCMKNKLSILGNPSGHIYSLIPVQVNSIPFIIFAPVLCEYNEMYEVSSVRCRSAKVHTISNVIRAYSLHGVFCAKRIEQSNFGLLYWSYIVANSHSEPRLVSPVPQFLFNK